MYACTTAHAQFARARYNRLNEHRYRWQVLSTAAYALYFPKGYDSLASFASLHLPDIIQQAKKATGSTLDQPLNIIIYPSLTQSCERNVGMNEPKIQAFPSITP